MWTPTALASEVAHTSEEVWRVVEDQYAASTRKLVDTKDEQALLEDILEESKPPVPEEAKSLHYLLQTPFRYDSPYPVGSRFRRAGSTEGVFYASVAIRTALAELCYYRYQFFADSPDTALPRHQQRLTVFSVPYASDHVIDLSKPPFIEQRDTWMHPSDYQATQALSDTARQAEVEVVRYEAVRDVEPGINVALLSPKVFRAKQPTARQTWFLYLSPTEANCERALGSADEQWTFLRESL